MGRRGRALRLAAVVVLLAACAEQSNVDPDAQVVVEGTVRDVDGSPLDGRPVRLGSGVTDAEGGLGFLTLGLSCLGGACSGDFFDTTTDDQGAYRFQLTGSDTRSGFGEAVSFLLSTSAEAPEGRPIGPEVSARFRVQTTALAMPTLALADARPVLAGDAGTVTATWDADAAPAPYRLAFFTSDRAALWEVAAAEPTVELDGRVLEDATGVALVSATRTDAVEGSDLDIVVRSSGVGFRGGFGPPPSRGVACQLRSERIAGAPLDRCPVTDGAHTGAGPPSFVCPEDGETTSTTTCEDAAAIRVLLRDPSPAQLVVVRGCADPCRVATVAGDGTVSDVGPVSGPFGTVRLDERPIAAVDIVTADVSMLTEVSVWPAVQVDSPLLPLADPGSLLPEPGGEDDDGDRWLPAVAAIVLLGVALILLGFALGRRSRQPRLR